MLPFAGECCNRFTTRFTRVLIHARFASLPATYPLCLSGAPCGAALQWDEVGHATHTNPMPMGNTDNGVLVLLLSRLLDEPAALACEAHALGAANLKRGEPITPIEDKYNKRYIPCILERMTKHLLLNRFYSSARLPWLRFYFPREGWHRSLEAGKSPSKPSKPGQHGKQHLALTSFQPQSDVLGHGWKAMGRAMVVPRVCAPLAVNSSGAAQNTWLSPSEETKLVVELCWWMHAAYGRLAYEACSTPADHGGVLLRFNVIHAFVQLKTVTLNLTQREAKRLFPTHRAAARSAHTAESPALARRKPARNKPALAPHERRAAAMKGNVPAANLDP